MTVAVFNGVVMVFVALILVARALLLGRGSATIDIEGWGSVLAPFGAKLHQVLSGAGVPLEAGCGGRGTCGSCRIRVGGEAGAPAATEVALLGEPAVARGLRLACQVTVRGPLQVALPEGLPAAAMRVTVRSTRNLTPLLKEIVLQIPDGTAFDFKAGSFVQVTCPPFGLRLAELPIDERFRGAWERIAANGLEAGCTRPTTRAYSLANYPGEGHGEGQGQSPIAMLVVRLALPPPGSARGTPAGVVSTYLFSLRPGDTVSLAGPFGHFVATESDEEMVFVGGGAGMAPLRAHVLEQILGRRTDRKISLWYGARSARDVIYADEFERLAREHPNFTWSVALSEPEPDEDWAGPVGFIHQHLHDAYLATHPAPAACEYYLCGPPLMVHAVVAMLERLGVDRAKIFYDDFGD